MRLPFTRDQFLDVFAAYNATLSPGAVALWLASAVIAALLLASSRRRPTDRLVSGLLAIHWAWSAVAYHIVFFTRINTAAWLFGGLFLVQAGMFAWLGVVRARLRFVPQQSAWMTIAWALVVYALVYPAINAVQHGTWLSIPDVRCAMSDHDLHRWAAYPRGATLVGVGDHSDHLVGRWRLGGAFAGRAG
jgi:hypothetical protein